MEIDFQNKVEDVLPLVRKRNLVALGQHQLADLGLVQKRLRGRQKEKLADAYLGQILRDLVIDTIESLKPATPENMNQLNWRHYIALREYVIHGKPWNTVADHMGLSRASFFEVKRQATGPLAMALWELEHEAQQRPTLVEDNLPRPPYSFFISRRDEQGRDYVDRIIDVLTSRRAYVVAIDGAPGVGKTTVAYKVAEVCRDRELFDAIVWITAKQVRLRPEGIFPLPQYQYVASVNAILDTIGKTVGNVRKVLTIPSTEEKLAIIRDVLLTTNCLIVLDNMEALTQDTHEEIFDFLSDLPGPSKALLTSRERHYIGESRITLSGMEENEAIRFMRIEAETRLLHSLSEEELRYIHRETNGIPLAMKHALGRMEIYGYTMKDAVRSGVEPDKLLDYMFDSTYQKLSDSQKRILHVMPIFVDPVLAETIRAATSLGKVQASVELGKLYQLFLVEKVKQNRGEAREERYGILPPLYRYLGSIRNREDLFSDGISMTSFSRKAHLNLAQYYKKCLNQRDIDGQLAFLKFEKRNIFGLLEWCHENGETSLMIDIHNVLGRALGVLGYSDERLKWGRRAIEGCKVLELFEQAAWIAAYDIAWAHIRSGEIEQGREKLEESLSVAREQGFRRVAALALHNLGRLHRNIGEIGKAAEHFEESLAIWETVNDPEWIARSMAALGRVRYEQNKLSEARSYLEQALNLRHGIKHENEVVETLSDLAVVALAQGEENEAFNFSDQSIYLGQDLPGPGPSYAYTLYRRAEIERLSENLPEAIQSAMAALEIYADFGVKYMAQEVREFLQQLDSAI